MKKRKRGSIVVISSNASKFPRKGMAAYAKSSSKHVCEVFGIGVS